MVSSYNSKNLRKIETARTEKEINKGAREGLFPLVKRVTPSNEIKSKYTIFQHEESGEISVQGDMRVFVGEGYKQIIGFTEYYPYKFPEPYAAYLIPPDLEVNEIVYIEDLIEDLVAARWNQGDAYRLESGIAKWNGIDFVILHDEPDGPTFLG